jgi:hypothetical protein
MVLIAGEFGSGLSRKERRKLRAEQRRQNAEHRRKAGKNVATLSAPGPVIRPRKKRKSVRKKTVRTGSFQIIKPASLIKKNKPVPPWAMRIVRELTDWNRDTEIHFRAPGRDDPDDVWQVCVNLKRSNIDAKEFTKLRRAARGLVWYIFSEDKHLAIKVWKERRSK